MIDALLTGRLASDPKPGTSRNGNPYATARIQATTNAEDRLTVSVISFDADTITALLALSAGDAVTLAGELTPKVWTDKDGNPHILRDRCANLRSPEGLDGQGRQPAPVRRPESAQAADPVPRCTQAQGDGRRGVRVAKCDEVRWLK